MERDNAKTSITIQFPTCFGVAEIKIKSIPYLVIPTFFGSPNEEPNVFLFEFDVLYHGYDHNTNAHKLKLFP